MAVALALVFTSAFVAFVFDATFAAAGFFTTDFVCAADCFALAAVFVVVDFLVVAMSILSLIKNPLHPSQGRRGLRGTTLLAPIGIDAACERSIGRTRCGLGWANT